MTKKQLLKGLNVLITRPEGQGLSLGEKVSESGGKPVFFPLLRITPLKDEQSLRVARELVENLDNYDMTIFISSNAVKFGLQLIDQYWSEFPPDLTVFAIGPVTAESLSSINTTVHSSPTGMQSEDLLSLPALQQVAGLKIALFRGRGGRELLADTLRDRGAQVDYVETYERSARSYDAEVLMTKIGENDINVICVTSEQILDSLCQLVDINKDLVSRIPLLVPSERIRAKALTAGFMQIINSAGANDEAILCGLETVASNLQS